MQSSQHMSFYLLPHFLLVSSVLTRGTITKVARQANETPCPGVVHITNDYGYCCIGGSLTLSVCEGWPICEGPTTVFTSTMSEYCATRIPLTASNYASLVESASSSYFDENGNVRSTVSTTTSGAESVTTSEETVASSTNGADESITGTGGSSEPEPTSLDGGASMLAPMSALGALLLAVAAML